MQQGTARGGFAHGEALTSRVYPDVLVVDREAGLCQLYVWDVFDGDPTNGTFVPAHDWTTPRRVDWALAEVTRDSSKHDIMAHPHVVKP